MVQAISPKNLHLVSVSDSASADCQALKGTGLTKQRNGQLILDGVDIMLEPGKICVIVGPSGAGKTTLLKTLALLEEPDSGSIEVDGQRYQYPLKRNNPVKPWPKLTVVFQQLFLWPHLTLKQNIELPYFLRTGKKSSDRFDELVALFDMEKFVHRYPNETSLGQRQRAALVRALLLEPKYILLDEITSSLDVEQVALILQYLRQLAQSGIGILIVTHLLQFAREAASSIIFMDAGRVLESGGRSVLDSPVHPRVRRFVSVIQSAS
jgi:polar amino acid transport system ATP-binding protein